MITCGFSAWVTVDGLPLQEYDIKISGSEATCWIASEIGKNFTVHWTYDNNVQCDNVNIDILLDGKFARGRIGTQVARTGNVDGILTSATSVKPFVFSRLDLTDDDAYLTATHAQIGEIKVEFHEAERFGTGIYRPSSFSEPGKVHERSKKAIGHQIGLGNEQQIALQSFVESRAIRLLATTIFRYRPIDVLRANGIAPPAPASKPPAEPARRSRNSAAGERKRPAPSNDVLDLTLSDDEPNGNEDAKEIQALEARLAALRNKKRKVSVKEEVKSEPGPSSIPKGRKRGQPAQLGVIDLT